MHRLLSFFTAFCLTFTQTAQAYSLAHLPYSHRIHHQYINAGHDLAILSAEDSASAISSVRVTHDGFTMGSSGLEFGKRNWSVNNGLAAEIMAGVNIFLEAPLVIPTFMQQINLNPVTLSNTIHNGTR